MTYVLDGREFYDLKNAVEWARVMAERDASLVYTSNDSVTKKEYDSYIEMRTKIYEKQIEIKEPE